MFEFRKMLLTDIYSESWSVFGASKGLEAIEITRRKIMTIFDDYSNIPDQINNFW